MPTISIFYGIFIAIRALGIIPPIEPCSPDDIKTAELTGRWTVRVIFNDGTEGEVNMERIANSGNAGVFTALRDPAFFAEAYIRFGTLTWPGELDLCPDTIYDAIKGTGSYVPG